jgi:hypothetical protein
MEMKPYPLLYITADQPPAGTMLCFSQGYQHGGSYGYDNEVLAAGIGVGVYRYPGYDGGAGGDA